MIWGYPHSRKPPYATVAPVDQYLKFLTRRALISDSLQVEGLGKDPSTVGWSKSRYFLKNGWSTMTSIYIYKYMCFPYDSKLRCPQIQNEYGQKIATICGCLGHIQPSTPWRTHQSRTVDMGSAQACKVQISLWSWVRNTTSNSYVAQSCGPIEDA